MKQLRHLLILLLCAAMLLAMIGCGKTAPKGSDPGKEEKTVTEINAVEYGCDNTGETDVTELMIALHEEAAEKNMTVYYPNGTYLFNGETLNFDGGVRFESPDGVLIRNSVSDVPIINFDDFGNLIGLMQNHLEKTYTADGSGDPTMCGNLVSPPLSTAKYETAVDFVPYWYNDFGRSCTRIHMSPNNWIGWYDWRWNHHGCEELGENYDPYDPAIHPLLGWYHGDDPVVLDWICYWLQEYGVKNVILLGAPSEGSEKPEAGEHWVYQLLNNAPNAKQMKFGVMVSSSAYNGSYDEYREWWFKTFEDFYFNEQYKDNVYAYEHNGKRYAVISLWDEHAVSFSLGQDRAVIKQLYYEVADAFKAHGFDGVSLWARMPVFSGDLTEGDRAEMLSHGVLWYGASYPSNGLGGAATYPENVETFMEMTNLSTLYGVATGLNTHTPHPSNWNCPGNTPAAFSRWVEKVLDVIQNNDKVGKAITCYNISEWSEGCSGLVPTVADRFGYLEAIRDNIVK